MCINEEGLSLMTKDLMLPRESGIKSTPVKMLITVAHINPYLCEHT